MILLPGFLLRTAQGTTTDCGGTELGPGGTVAGIGDGNCDGYLPALRVDATLSHSLTEPARQQPPPRRQRRAGLTPVSHTAAQPSCHWNRFCFRSTSPADFREQGSHTGERVWSVLEKAQRPEAPISVTLPIAEACRVEGLGVEAASYSGQWTLRLGDSPPPLHRAPCPSIKTMKVPCRKGPANPVCLPARTHRAGEGRWGQMLAEE